MAGAGGGLAADAADGARAVVVKLFRASRRENVAGAGGVANAAGAVDLFGVAGAIDRATGGALEAPGAVASSAVAGNPAATVAAYPTVARFRIHAGAVDADADADAANAAVAAHAAVPAKADIAARAVGAARAVSAVRAVNVADASVIVTGATAAAPAAAIGAVDAAAAAADAAIAPVPAKADIAARGVGAARAVSATGAVKAAGASVIATGTTAAAPAAVIGAIDVAAAAAAADASDASASSDADAVTAATAAAASATADTTVATDAVGVTDAGGGVIDAAPRLPGRQDDFPRPPRPEEGTLYLSVSINGRRQSGDALVLRQDGRLLVLVQDLGRWGVTRPGTATLVVDGQQYQALDALAGVEARIDEGRQELVLFDAQRVSIVSARPDARPRLKLSPTVPSVTLDYNLSVQMIDESLSLNGAVGAAASLAGGSLTSQAVVSAGAGRTSLTRLDTAFVRDFPDRMQRLVIGDSVSRPGGSLTPFRFGGVQFGSAFDLQPDFIAFPVPQLSGQAALPSTVELLIDNAVRFQSQVDQGHFVLTDAPLVAGDGSVSLVVRDAMGIERRTERSYYLSPRLLKPGLSAWTVEAGALRRGYGVRSFDYGALFGAATLRRGLSEQVTVEGRAELSGDVQDAAVSTTFVIAPIGEFLVGATLSRADGVVGGGYRIGFQRSGPRWRFSADYHYADADFRQLGFDLNRAEARRQLQVQAGFSLGRLGTIGLSYSAVKDGDGRCGGGGGSGGGGGQGDRPEGGGWRRAATANYQVALHRGIALSAFGLLTRVADGRRQIAGGATINFYFGGRRSASVAVRDRGVRATMQQRAPAEGGFGYRLAADLDAGGRQEARVDWRNGVVDLTLTGSRLGGSTAFRLDARGGMTYVDGRIFVARQMGGAFALVDAPGLPGIGVYRDNILVGHTDDRGRVLIPRLRANQINRISIRPQDVPMNISIDQYVLEVVPPLNGAARAGFTSAGTTGAIVTLALPDGSPVPEATPVQIDGGEILYVGFEGQLFLPAAYTGQALRIDPMGADCRTTLPLIPAGALPAIGPIRCPRREIMTL